MTKNQPNLKLRSYTYSCRSNIRVERNYDLKKSESYELNAYTFTLKDVKTAKETNMQTIP